MLNLYEYVKRQWIAYPEDDKCDVNDTEKEKRSVYNWLYIVSFTVYYYTPSFVIGSFTAYTSYWCVCARDARSRKSRHSPCK